MARTIWLVGMMGSGKSTVGEELARRRRVAFYDTDALIVERLGHSIAEVWDLHGEEGFRDVESAQVDRLAGQDAVVATGGGVVLRPSNVETMRGSGPVVWLRTSVAELAERVGGGEGRPLLTGGSVDTRLSAVLDTRRELYEKAAAVVIDTDGKTVGEVSEEVEQWIES
ncbi:MAG TPA: shikimate kinase [Acidimicrobiia bacterium]